MGLPYETAAYTLIGMATRFQDFFYAPEQDVTFEYMNENGEVKTATVPNVAKIKKQLDTAAVTDAELADTLKSYYDKVGVDAIHDAIMANFDNYYNKSDVDTKIDEFDGTIGEVVDPIFYAPLMNDLSIVIGTGTITYERPSTGIYRDKYGIMQKVYNDEPMFGPNGIILEPGTTNLTTWSEDVSKWEANGDTTIVKNSDKIWEDGFTITGADEGTCSNGYNNLRSPNVLNTIKDKTYTMTVDIKSDGSTLVHARLCMPTDDSQYVTTTSDEWVRVKVTCVANDNGVANRCLFYSDGGKPFSIRNLQIEQAVNATSYYPTTDTIRTRASSNLVISYYNNVTGNFEEVAYSMDYTHHGSLHNDNMTLLEKGNDLYNLIRINFGKELGIYADGTTIGNVNIPQSELHNVIATYKPLDKKGNVIASLYSDGVNHATSAPQMYHTPNAEQSLTIGSRYDKHGDILNGTICNVKIFNKIPSDKAIKLLGGKR